MFDIAWSELLLIAVVALIFIGPKELPAVLRNLGQMTAKLRRSADEFRRHFEDSMRESGYEDVHRNIQDLRSLSPANQLRTTLENAINPNLPPRAAPLAEPAPAVPVPPEELERLARQAEASALAAEAGYGGEVAQTIAAGAPAFSEQKAPAAEGVQMPAAEPVKDCAAPAG